MLQPLTRASILLLNLQNLYSYNPKYARYPTAANVFIYFYLNDAYQIRLLKIGFSLWVV